MKEYGLSNMAGELDAEETCERILDIMEQIEKKSICYTTDSKIEKKTSFMFRSIST